MRVLFATNRSVQFPVSFQHLVFFIGRMIDWGVPDVPESLQLKIKRENYLAKQALTDNIQAEVKPVSSIRF